MDSAHGFMQYAQVRGRPWCAKRKGLLVPLFSGIQNGDYTATERMSFKKEAFVNQHRLFHPPVVGHHGGVLLVWLGHPGKSIKITCEIWAFTWYAFVDVETGTMGKVRYIGACG